MGELQNLSSRRLLQQEREIFAGIHLPDRCHRAAHRAGHHPRDEVHEVRAQRVRGGRKCTECYDDGT